MASAVKDLMSRQLIRQKNPDTINLFQLLSHLPQNGINARVQPITWSSPSSSSNHFYTITNVHLTPGMTQGIVSGVLSDAAAASKGGDTTPRRIPHELAYKHAWKLVYNNK